MPQLWCYYCLELLTQLLIISAVIVQWQSVQFQTMIFFLINHHLFLHICSQIISYISPTTIMEPSDVWTRLPDSWWSIFYPPCRPRYISTGYFCVKKKKIDHVFNHSTSLENFHWNLLRLKLEILHTISFGWVWRLVRNY